ncbi:MAG TPA: rhodanese-like domain-containing protein [Candidatus Acidoferrum sp.]|nr:rhodanese-like domain-containing protein [Candidatus Acidoferrum sp.]
MRRATVCLAILILPWMVAGSILAGTQLTQVSVDQAKEMIQKHGGTADFVVLDVRTPQEFAEGHLPSGVNLNLMTPDFGRRLAAMDRSKTYLVYCRTGNRSAKAIQIMERLGFQSVNHMYEGIVGWQKKGF